jgi:hypothetical protein
MKMRHFSLAAATAVGLLAGLAPTAASARVVELGATPTSLVAPVCPAGVDPVNCTIVLTEVTALETIRDSVTYPTKVTKAGQIVAFTLGLSGLSTSAATAKADIHFLDSTYGGTTRAAITVLKPVGPKAQRRWTVAAESPAFHLQPYLGEVVQFPLATSLPVTPGETIALTVPTWAPVLSFGLPVSKFAYRQSRSSSLLPTGEGPSCKFASGFTTPKGHVLPDTAQLSINSSTSYGCNYAGARVEYTATEVTNPAPSKRQIHAADTVARASRATTPTTRHDSGGAGLAPRVLARAAGFR